jgi:hypothetical protein
MPIQSIQTWLTLTHIQFLIKGVTYSPRKPNTRPGDKESYIDPLGEDWLPELRKDIPFFHQLGINTIFVDHADPTQSPEHALQLLQDEGIYVLLELFTNIHLKDSHRIQAADIDLQRLYSPSKVRKNLAIVSQTAHFPNILSYSISQSDIHSSASTKLAALYRAAVRDTKLFIRKTGARQIPVGANLSFTQQFRLGALQYMTAGSPEERVDFMSFAVYDWVGPSSFVISGYKNLCEAFEPWPVPMFWAEYGTAYHGRARVMDEVECVFSPDMTGVFSGGFLHTFGHTEAKRAETKPSGDEVAKDDDSENGGEDDDSDSDSDIDEDDSGYDLVRIEEDGTRCPKRDFTRYQQKLADVGNKPMEEVVGQHEMKDFESWRGNFEPRQRWWEADAADAPLFPLEWDQVVE